MKKGQRSGVLKIMTGCFVASLAIAPALAGWSESDTRDCVASCQVNEKVDPQFRHQCPNYCACISSESYKKFSEAAWSRILKDMAAHKESRELRQFRAIFPMCSKRELN